MKLKVDFRAKVSCAIRVGMGSPVIGSTGVAVRGARGLGDRVSENDETGMGLPVGMGVGDDEGDALGLG